MTRAFFLLLMGCSGGGADVDDGGFSSDPTTGPQPSMGVQIARATATSPTTIVVNFDHLLDSATADLSAITVDGIDVVERVLDGIGSRVVVHTSVQQPGQTLTVQVGDLVDRVGTSASGAEAVVTGWQTPAHRDYLEYGAPFEDVELIYVDREDRVWTSPTVLGTMYVLEPDWVTLTPIEVPDVAISGEFIHAFQERVWFGAERSVLEWTDQGWVEHREQVDADPWAHVKGFTSTADTLYVLYGFQTTTRIYAWDGVIWTPLTDPPAILNAIWMDDDGVIWGAGQTGMDQVYRFDGSAWTERAIDVEYNFVPTDIRVLDDIVFIAGNMSTNGVGAYVAVDDGTETVMHSVGGLISNFYGKLTTTPDGKLAFGGKGVHVWNGTSFDAVPGTENVSNAAFDRHGNLWATDWTFGGYAGLTSVQLFAY
jgi:hypothetical protein